MKRYLGILVALAMVWVGCSDEVVGTAPDVEFDLGLSDPVIIDWSGSVPDVEDDPIDPDDLQDEEVLPDVDDDLEPPESDRQSTLSFTYGGGSVSTSNYSLSLYIGGLSPTGGEAAGGHELQLGPGAINFQY